MSSKYTIYYSQNREDIILSGFFRNRKNPGFYIDVGAGNPMTDSVTRLFYEQGWTGINIEPVPHIFEALNTHRKRDKNLNIGISNIVGKLKFREYAADGFSTFSKSMQKQYVAEPDQYTSKFYDYEVQTQTLAMVFNENKADDVQFLKIDVEGYEYEVIESNDWVKYRPEVVCVEAEHVIKDWRSILKKYDYTLVFSDGLNEYYVDSKKPQIVFNYVDSVINRDPIIRYDVAEYIDTLEDTIKQLKHHTMDIQKEALALDKNLKKAEKELRELNNPAHYVNKMSKIVAHKAKKHIRNPGSKKT